MYDTIIAIATPIGESAIGVIRLSGKDAISICSKTLVNGEALLKQKKNTLKLYQIIFPDNGEIIDSALIAVYQSPRSYTGEDIVEIFCHGSPLILKEILELFLSLGVRSANPGEFTERAYLNGKMDLTQAEAVNDLIRSHTKYARLSALNQLQGKFSGSVNRIHSQILDLLAHIEARIDHSDLAELSNLDEKFLDYPFIKFTIEKIIDEINLLLKTADSGRMTRQGIAIAIIGAPNTGKSSLMNLLLREDRVIVSEIPGTTRDIIEDELNIKGITVRISDTAGIRKTSDIIESKGIARTKKAIEESDLRIMLFDCSREILEEDFLLLDLVRNLKCIFVLNKTDLPMVTDEKMLSKRYQIKAIPISITQKTGIDKIEMAIADYYYSFGFDPVKDVLVTNVRQEDLLKKSVQFLKKAQKAIVNQLSEEFIASDIRKARACIEEITGKTTDDSILDRIFSQFCIGK